MAIHTIHVPDNVSARMKILAEQDDRSLSSLYTIAAKRFLAGRGIDVGVPTKERMNDEPHPDP